MDCVVHLAQVEQSEDFRLLDRPLDRAAVHDVAEVHKRAGDVGAGMPSTVVMSCAVSVTLLWTSIACLALAEGLGREMSLFRRLSARRPHRPAAERCESAALGPHASTAAIQ